MEILPLKKTNVQSIYSVLLDWLKKKDLQCSKLVWALMELQHLLGRNRVCKHV